MTTEHATVARGRSTCRRFSGCRSEASDDRRERVVNDAFGRGCSSSIAPALSAVDERAELLVLMLGDMHGVEVASVEALLEGRCDARGRLSLRRPAQASVWLRPAYVQELAHLHGDNGVWRLLDQRASEVAKVRIAAPVPLDVEPPKTTRQSWPRPEARRRRDRCRARRSRDRQRQAVSLPTLAAACDRASIRFGHSEAPLSAARRY
jgi:CTP:molybdopterin cytidylyltransferase MocA